MNLSFRQSGKMMKTLGLEPIRLNSPEVLSCWIWWLSGGEVTQQRVAVVVHGSKE